MKVVMDKLEPVQWQIVLELTERQRYVLWQICAHKSSVVEEIRPHPQYEPDERSLVLDLLEEIQQVIQRQA